MRGRTTGSPSLGALLELEEDVPSAVVVVEEVHVVDDEDERFAGRLRVTERDLLKLVQGYPRAASVDVKATPSEPRASMSQLMSQHVLTALDVQGSAALARVSPLEQTCLGILVVLVVQRLAET